MRIFTQIDIAFLFTDTSTDDKDILSRCCGDGPENLSQDMLVSKPLVTVIIPTYNRAGLLPQAIESVLNQSLADFELLIVDDGSSDDTRQMVAALPDARIQYIYQANQGISGAVNTGVSKARGEFIARLDSDDLWLPDMLKEIIGALEANPACGLAYARTQTMDASGTLLDEFRGLPLWFPEDSFASMLYGDVTCNTSIVARRACFERVGLYDPSFKVHEDWDMWLRIARVFPFYFLDKVVALCRYHAENITGVKSQIYTAGIDDRIRILEKAYSEGNMPEKALEIKPLAFANTYVWMGSDWWAKRCYGKALARFWKAWQVRRYSIVAFFEIAWGVTGRLFLWKITWGRQLILKVGKLKNR